MKRMACIVCLLLPLGLLAAPAQSREKTSPPTTSSSAAAVAPAAMSKPDSAPPIVAGRIALPSPQQAIRELRQSLAHSIKPARRSLVHFQLGRDLRVAFVDRPHWSTTAPRSPRTFSIAFFSLSW